jgi:osmotically inducible lipoprotein OsmB
MRRLTLPLAVIAALTLSACQSTDADTTMRTAGGAGIGAAGGAIIGAVTGKPGTGAAVGAALGAGSGFLYDQYQRSSYAR